MNCINKQIKNTLKVILSVMMIFSSILVVNPSPIISEEINEEAPTEVVEEVVETKEELPTEIVEEVKQEVEKEDEEVVEETKEETPAETDEVTDVEEQSKEETEPTEEELEEVDDVKQKPLLIAGSMLGATKTYTVTFNNGLKKIGSIEVEAGSTIDVSKIPADPYADWRSASKSPVWYYREGGLIFYREYKWNFDNMTVDKNITLYVKYENIGSSGSFDFRVKHEQSNVLSEFNTGTYTNVENGYTYSYYSYETGVKFSYTEGTDDDRYTGTSFDLAIQESNAGDTIEILKNIKITQPINIWGDVNLNLNNKTITCDTSFITKIINFINDFWEMLGSTQPLIRVKDNFSPAIFVYNARTTISNGTIDNKKGELGHGVVVYSENSDYVTHLENLNITTASGADAVSAGYEGTRTNNQGLPTQAFATGYAVITGGYYEGKIANYNQDGSLIINGGNYTANPIANNAKLGTDKFLYKNQPGEYNFKVSDYSNEAVIVDENNVEISNETLASALNNATSGQKIKIVKDILLNNDLVINPNGRSLTLDVYGHNIITNNNSKISIVDSSVENQGEIEFINSCEYFNGQVDVEIEANSKGIAIINDGYYNSATGNNMNVKGGYFVNEVNSNSLFNDNYICYKLDQVFNKKYNYKVIEKEKLYVAKIGEIKYTSLVTAINSAKANDTIIILQDIDLLEPVTINKSLTISLPKDLNIYSYALNSFAIKKEIESDEKTEVTFVGSGSIINRVLANKNDVTIFEVQSNAKLIMNALNIYAEAKGCEDKELVAIKTTGNKTSLELNGTYVSIPKIDSKNKYITAIKNESNEANISLINEAWIDVYPCENDCLRIEGIVNSGNQSIINITSSYIYLNSVGNQKDNINCKGIYDNSSNSKITLDGAEILVSNDQGLTSGISIENNSSLEVKGSSISVTVIYDSNTSRIQTGISSNGSVNVENSSVILNFADYYARNTINAINANGNVVVLNNANIIVKTSFNGYCVVADNNANVSIKGANSYYFSSNDNQIININSGTVEISGGHFSDDITVWLARNYKCTYNPVIDGTNTYNYAVDYSNCGLGVTVANDGTLVINYKITFDPIMLKNPDDYGVRFISNTLSEYNDVVFSITDTKNEKSDTNKGLKSKFEASEGRGVYSFNIAARLMDANVGVEIINIKKDHVYHRKNAYSVKDYYYAILESKNPDGSYVYSATMRDLAAAALNYGAYCQETLNNIIESSMLVNANLGNYKNEEGVNYSKETSDAYNDEINDIGESKKATGSLAEKFIFAGHSLVLRASTTLRFRFKIEGSSSVNGYEAYYRNLSNNETEFTKVIPQEDGETYYIDIPGIKSYNLNNNFELKIVKGSDSCIVTYGPLNYIYKQFVEATEKSLKLAKVLYAYYKSASVYYGD